MRLGHLSEKGLNVLVKRNSPPVKGPKCRGRAQGKLRRTREARRMDKKQKKKAQSSIDHAPSRWRRARAPLPNGKVSVGGAPAPPYFVTSKTRTLRARAAAAELTKMKAILGISLFRALAHPLLKPYSTYMGEE
ncbi:hypothetical protein PIB30_021149 [Stylosanthes scabra]|uniref:Uncharacterized protein n=1 Tax=Stylosanthes scabra TaxID=79078 RepID=A0ABU6R951_9FABA|nr:hypothetical protein [Stylosanthes scabra]